MNRISQADLERARLMLATIKRPDIPCELETDVQDDEDRFPDTRLALDGGAYFIEGTWLEQRSILGPRKVPGYRVYTFKTTYNYPHAPDDVDEVEIGATQALDDALMMAFYSIVGDEWSRYCESVVEAEMASEAAYYDNPRIKPA